MLTLSLLRHAKSSWDSPAFQDRDRPLAPRGKTAAPMMGRAMAEHGLDPGLVLCSSARRTRDTLGLVLPELKVEPRVLYEDDLYHANSAEMLQILRAVGTGVSKVMMVGHNPELQVFGLDLIGAGPKRLRERLMLKMPTAALVVVTFDVGAWSKVTINSGELTMFLTPKDLAES